MSEKRARHFHAGKLRKTIDGTEFVSVKESGDTLFVSRDGLLTSASRKWRTTKGNLERDGYRRINVDGRHAVVARIVYEVFVGQIPDDKEIDHINTVRDDNRVENLHVVTHRDNLLNPLTRPRRKVACARNGAKGAAAQGRDKFMAAMRLGWDALKKPVDVTVNGTTTRYATIKAAARSLGIAQSTMRNMVLGTVKRHWGKLAGVSAKFAEKEAANV